MMKYLFIYLVLISIILFFAYKNSQITQIKESFHPSIRQWYRPLIRNTRLYSNKWYQSINEKIIRFWRKIGWLK
jgi:hypothetical protein